MLGLLGGLLGGGGGGGSNATTASSDSSISFARGRDGEVPFAVQNKTVYIVLGVAVFAVLVVLLWKGKV